MSEEWCTDCKEYDHEKHCCPRFNKVIRTTLNDSINSVIDEIRSEIEELKIEEDSHNICFKVHNNVVEAVLRIIDKYKAESEGEK